MKQTGMVIGQKGVQYGLQRPAGPGGAAAAKKPAAGAPGGARPAANVFGVDSDDDEDVATQVARQAEKKRATVKVQQMYEQALTEDPSVFDYDGVYDSMQAAAVAPKQADKLTRQSKYIASLKEQAERRKREADVAFERRSLKERQAEDHLYEDKEKFVTGAYRRKLEEDKKWQEAEKAREAEEERNDVRKVGHLGNFYMNLMTKNVAMGGTGSNPAAAPAAATSKPAAAEEEEEAEGAGADVAARDDQRRGGGSEAGGSGRSSAEPGGAGPPAAAAGGGPGAKVLSALDKYDLLRLEAERAVRQRKAADAVAAAAAGRPPPGPGPDAAAPAPPRREEDRPQPSGAGADGAGKQGAQAAAAAADAAAAAQEAAAGAGKRRNDDTSVQSARERYLARKAQKLQ